RATRTPRRPTPRRRARPRPRGSRPGTARRWAGRCRRSSRRPSHRHLADADVPLAGPDRDFLAALAADPGLHEEVVADRVDRGERVEAVADQRRAGAGAGHLAVLDQVALGDAEDEVAGRRVDLAATERHRVEAVFDLFDHRLGGRLPGRDVGVGHPRQGQVAEALAAAVAGRGDPVALGTEVVVEVGDELAVLDHQRFLRRPALIVDRVAPPLVGEAAVVVGVQERLGDLLAELADVDAGALV